jgi:hypothetical protein
LRLPLGYALPLVKQCGSHELFGLAPFCGDLPADLLSEDGVDSVYPQFVVGTAD